MKYLKYLSPEMFLLMIVSHFAEIKQKLLCSFVKYAP